MEHRFGRTDVSIVDTDVWMTKAVCLGALRRMGDVD